MLPRTTILEVVAAFIGLIGTIVFTPAANAQIGDACHAPTLVPNPLAPMSEIDFPFSGTIAAKPDGGEDSEQTIDFDVPAGVEIELVSTVTYDTAFDLELYVRGENGAYTGVSPVNIWDTNGSEDISGSAEREEYVVFSNDARAARRYRILMRNAGYEQATYEIFVGTNIQGDAGQPFDTGNTPVTAIAIQGGRVVGNFNDGATFDDVDLYRLEDVPAGGEIRLAITSVEGRYQDEARGYIIAQIQKPNCDGEEFAIESAGENDLVSVNVVNFDPANPETARARVDIEGDYFINVERTYGGGSYSYELQVEYVDGEDLFDLEVTGSFSPEESTIEGQNLVFTQQVRSREGGDTHDGVWLVATITPNDVNVSDPLFTQIPAECSIQVAVLDTASQIYRCELGSMGLDESHELRWSTSSAVAGLWQVDETYGAAASDGDDRQDGSSGWSYLVQEATTDIKVSINEEEAAPVGRPSRYAVTITNEGNVPVAEPVLTFRVSGRASRGAQVRFMPSNQQIQSEPLQCGDAIDGVVECQIGVEYSDGVLYFAPGASDTFRFQVMPIGGGSLELAASVPGDDNESAPADNARHVETEIEFIEIEIELSEANFPLRLGTGDDVGLVYSITRGSSGGDILELDFSIDVNNGQVVSLTPTENDEVPPDCPIGMDNRVASCRWEDGALMEGDDEQWVYVSVRAGEPGDMILVATADTSAAEGLVAVTTQQTVHHAIVDLGAYLTSGLVYPVESAEIGETELVLQVANFGKLAAEDARLQVQFTHLVAESVAWAEVAQDHNDQVNCAELTDSSFFCDLDLAAESEVNIPFNFYASNAGSVAYSISIVTEGDEFHADRFDGSGQISIE